MHLLCFATMLLYHSANGDDAPAKLDIPVVLLDKDGVLEEKAIENDPFHLLNATFDQIISECVEKSDVIIVFVEETLTTEDFSMRIGRDDPFAGIRGLLLSGKARYFPAVHDPLKLLTSKIGILSDNVFHITNTSSAIRIFPNDLKNLYIVFLDSESEDKAKKKELLRRHERIVLEVYAAVRDLKRSTSYKVTAFYTGVQPTPAVEKGVKTRGDEVSSLESMFSHDVGMFYLDQVEFVNQGVRSYLTGTPKIREVDTTADETTAVLEYEQVELRFHFAFMHDSWELDAISLYQAGRLMGSQPLYAGARLGRSYACGDSVVVGGHGSTVTLGHFQVQPTKDSGDGEAKKSRFDDADVCTSLVTVPILMGLAVVGLMLGILAFGVIMMLDLRVYDRFDNPHGKPLAIASQD